MGKPHQQLAHEWAQDTDRSGKGFNVFYEGPVIYSYGYHFPLARFVTTPSGERVILRNPDSRSVSTSKHQTFVSRAIQRDRYKVFSVPDLDARADYAGAGGAAVIAAYQQTAVEKVAKAKRARVYGPMLLDEALRAIDSAEAFALAFDIPYQRPADLDALAATMEAERKAAAIRAREFRLAQEAAQRLEDADKFAAWQNGQGYGVPYSYRTAPDGSAYVRRSGDELQTSQGASVPWDHAVKAFRFIKLCRERGEGFKTNGRVVRVGHFRVDEIDAQGNMAAGCHKFSWAEIERLAIREGVFDVAPSADAVEVSSAVVS